MDPTPASDNTAAVAFVKRKSKGNVRKRTLDETEEPADPQAAISAALAASGKRSRAVKGGTAFSTKKDDDDKLQTFKYSSSKTLQQQSDQGATAVLQTETQHDRDARALREQVLKQAQDNPEEAAADGPALYKGLNNYTDYKQGFRREQTIGSEKGGGAHGPLRASQHVRTTVIFDYKPDICKDYKETGYCGYGDACKFVHDRGDYKSGWELEKEWDERQAAKKQIANFDPYAEAPEEEEEDDLPFACYICRRPWEEVQEPVVTQCKHYFCEQCALKHNAKSGKCFVCEKPTRGIFNVANDILKKVQQKKS
ncbi:hypothetical protein WJX79_004262 [Trebouxia sp. C0005]|nr:MAG: zinc finger CCCH domain-containing 51 [Trebouxia sp. A1-2]